MSGLRIALALDALALDDDAPADVAGVLAAACAVEAALRELGHESWRVPVRRDGRSALAALLDGQPDLVFNLCETVGGRAEGEARLIAALELAGVPVTGAGSEVVSLARRKDHMGAVLALHGVPVPRSRLVEDGRAATAQPVAARPRESAWDDYPCIVKPAGEDGSVGITQASVASDAPGLARAIRAAEAHAPLLVQQLLPGRELNVAIVADELLPISEIEYRDVPAGTWPVVDYAAKWEPGSPTDRMTVPQCPARLPDTLAAEARAVAQAAWRAAGGSGVGRIDLRGDAAGRLHVLEVNPNPDLAPGAGLARMAAAHGWSYAVLVRRLVEDALARARGPASGPASGPAGGAGGAARTASEPLRGTDAAPYGSRNGRAPDALRIEPLPRRVRGDVERILVDTGMFRDDEVVIALEVIDAYYANPDQDYTALGAFSQAGELVGYSCHGPTPCTLGTWDLYWIAVAPSAQRTGAGSALMQEVERRLSGMDARMLLIETSSQLRYQPTRAFYQRRGYHEVARVPDFYAPGDDRVIFAKRIQLAHTG